MINRAVNDYAFAHARIRARIGLMPNESTWQRILDTDDLETTIETMSTSGLAYWVNDFPRNPRPDEIERRCLIGLLGIALFVSHLLPRRWQATGRYIAQLPHVMQIRPLLSTRAEKGFLLPGSPFTEVLSQAVEQRAKTIKASKYGVYIDSDKIPEVRWAEQLHTQFPTVRGHEQQLIRRIIQLLSKHQHMLNSPLLPEQIWSQRKTLFEQLKYLLAGNPFHAGTLFVYGLLESIQFERVRAILLLRAYQWPPPLLRGLN